MQMQQVLTLALVIQASMSSALPGSYAPPGALPSASSASLPPASSASSPPDSSLLLACSWPESDPRRAKEICVCRCPLPGRAAEPPAPPGPSCNPYEPPPAPPDVGGVLLGGRCSAGLDSCKGVPDAAVPKPAGPAAAATACRASATCWRRGSPRRRLHGRQLRLRQVELLRGKKGTMEGNNCKAIRMTGWVRHVTGGAEGHALDYRLPTLMMVSLAAFSMLKLARSSQWMSLYRLTG